MIWVNKRKEGYEDVFTEIPRETVYLILDEVHGAKELPFVRLSIPARNGLPHSGRSTWRERTPFCAIEHEP